MARARENNFLRDFEDTGLQPSIQQILAQTPVVQQPSMAKQPTMATDKATIIDNLVKQIQARSNTSQWSGGVGADQTRKKYSIEQLDKIIHNPKFDVNVKMEAWNRSILYELTHNYYCNSSLKPFVEYLLKHKDIIVSNDLVTSLIATKNTDMLALFKKHKKIPKALKGLI